MSKEYVMQLEATIANLRRDNVLLKDIKKKQEIILKILLKNRIDIESFYTMFVECNLDYKYYKEFYENYGLQQLTEAEFNLLKGAFKR